MDEPPDMFESDDVDLATVRRATSRRGGTVTSHSAEGQVAFVSVRRIAAGIGPHSNDAQ